MQILRILGNTCMPFQLILDRFHIFECQLHRIAWLLFDVAFLAIFDNFPRTFCELQENLQHDLSAVRGAVQVIAAVLWFLLKNANERFA